MRNFQGTMRLVLAMARCAKVYGEAQWTNGYRAAYEAWARGMPVRGAKVEAEQKRLHEKEMKQWDRVADVDADFERIASEVLAAANRKKGSATPKRTLRRRGAAQKASER